mmetsp:Transcript_94884/g.251961  ORF Transcript_94884/g.251961 Transcript_94884/m.251961 type:complete len:254 (+) Transcript_94884:271-1032(+)
MCICAPGARSMHLPSKWWRCHARRTRCQQVRERPRDRARRPVEHFEKLVLAEAGFEHRLQTARPQHELAALVRTARRGPRDHLGADPDEGRGERLWDEHQVVRRVFLQSHASVLLLFLLPGVAVPTVPVPFVAVPAAPVPVVSSPPPVLPPLFLSPALAPLVLGPALLAALAPALAPGGPAALASVPEDLLLRLLLRAAVLRHLVLLLLPPTLPAALPPATFACRLLVTLLGPPLSPSGPALVLPVLGLLGLG